MTCEDYDVDAAEMRFGNDMSQLGRERDYWKAECRDMLSEFYDTESEPCPMLEYPRPASACAPSILAMAVRQGMDERIAELELLVRFMVPFFESACSHECGCPDGYFEPHGCDDGCKALKELHGRMRGLGMEVDA